MGDSLVLTMGLRLCQFGGPQRTEGSEAGVGKGSRQDMRHSDERTRQWSTARRLVSMVVNTWTSVGAARSRARTVVSLFGHHVHPLDKLAVLRCQSFDRHAVSQHPLTPQQFGGAV